MSNLLHMPRPDPDESWLTTERLTAYYVAISVMPEIVEASAVVRATVIDRALAGLRAVKLEDAIDAKGMDACIALMRTDAEAAQRRAAQGGW